MKMHLAGQGQRMSNSKINHPAHYGGDTVYETIKVIEAWELNFNLGNAVKYISRAGKKFKEGKGIIDLQKAVWYIEREIKNRTTSMPVVQRKSSQITKK